MRKVVLNGSIVVLFFLFLTLINHGGNPDEASIIETPQLLEEGIIPDSGNLTNDLFEPEDQIYSSSISTSEEPSNSDLQETKQLEEIETLRIRLMHNSDSKTDPIDYVARDRALALINIAQDLSDLNLYREGIPWVHDALMLDPGLPEAHLASGYLNFKLLQTEEAIADFEKTIELDPANYDAHLYLGIIYNGNEDPARALNYLTEAIQLADSPRDISTAFANRALSYALLEQYDECFADFDDALFLDPDNGWAIFFRGIVLEELANREKVASEAEGIPGDDLGFTK
jgi:tetratricopeptide (TPR) repeat protein